MFRRGKRSHDEDQPSQDVYGALRSQVLELDPTEAGFSPSEELPRVVGVVMDMAYDTGSATVVAIADGSTSLYTSGGGGTIGGGAHAPVVEANRQLLLTAEEHLDSFAARSATDVPAPGRVAITVLTYAGPMAVEAPEDDFGEDRHPAAPVFYAVHDVITALRMIDEGAAPGTTDGPATEVTPLMAAAHGGDLELVAQLIAGGAGVQAHDDVGYTSLMYAANAGQEDVVALLLAHGADPNAGDHQGSTPLMFAAQHDHTGIVTKLLAAGANPNACGQHGLTPLAFARQNNHRRAIALLTDGGAL